MEQKEINILLYGESGVGKSTWINAFVMYSMFPTLEYAMKQDHPFAIPAKVNVDVKGVATNLTSGEDSNENTASDGKSGTRAPRNYEFSDDQFTIRLIDTPGLSDTEGDDADKSNLEMILNHLSSSNITRLHAICILVKAGECRLSPSLRKCLKALLSYLHDSAKQNIIYCLTNSSSTRFKADKAWPILNTFVKEEHIEESVSKEKMFCFDQEVVEFLVKYKNGNISGDDLETELDAVKASWKKSVDSTTKMMHYLSKIAPHDFSKSDVVIKARRLAMNVAEPMIQAARCVADNKMMTVQVLDHGEVVCCHAGCTRVVRGEVAYPQVCVDNCWKFTYTFISFFWFGDCEKCKHNWSSHKWTNVRYTFKDDPEAYKAKEENVKIIATAAKLAKFLEKSTVVENNQDVNCIKKYIDEQIETFEKSEDCDDQDARAKTLLAYKELRKDYEQKVDEERSNQCTYTPSQVHEFIAELYGLTKFGKMIEKAVIAMGRQENPGETKIVFPKWCRPKTMTTFWKDIVGRFFSNTDK
jgi:GTPase SAR1 family protein